MVERIAAAALDGVADGVAKVQHLAHGVVLLVLGHHVPLDGHAVGDDPLDVRAGGVLQQKVDQLLAADHTVLNDLRPALGLHLGGQGGQYVGVAQDQVGLGESAHQVLALGQVHSGLAPHGGIHHRQQGGGQLHTGDAPEVQGGRQPRHVPGDAAAQGKHGIRPGHAHLGQTGQQLHQGVGVLGLLPGGEYEVVHLKACILQTGLDHGPVQGPHIAVRDDYGVPSFDEGGGQLAGAGQQARADADLVVPGCVYRNGLHGKKRLPF